MKTRSTTSVLDSEPYCKDFLDYDPSVNTPDSTSSSTQSSTDSLQLVDSDQEGSSVIGIQSDDGGSVKCECPCCSMNGPPSQPIDVKESKHTYSHHNQYLSQKKSYCKSIQPSWYKHYPWITVCTTSYKILCHSCHFTVQKGFITFSECNVNSFVEEGFCNCKKSTRKA